MSFPYLSEDKELNEETRKEVDSGAFISLSDGVTHYQLDGRPDGQVVILVHGFSVPYFIFDPTFEFLIQEGFRVLRYDLFGRGWSDRPMANYDIHLYVRQLKELLDAVALRQVALIGLSMGGPISAAFTAQNPGYVSQYVLIDPAGARPITLSKLLKLTKLPFIGELALGLLGSGSMLKSIAADFFDPALIEEFQSRYRVQMQFKGFKSAILATMRNGMLDSFSEVYRDIGRLGKPTLLFWGCNDTTIPFEHNETIRAAIPHAEFHPVENCGHIPHFEKPEIVNSILKKFLQANAQT
jgi:pimeloyl-ACP methyl ester carboxylesterase